MQFQNNRKTPKLKVTIYINIKITIIQGTANPRYKTTLCKKFSSGKLCPYGDKCQFAHGDADLRNKADNLHQMNNSFPMMMPMVVPPGMDMNQMQQIMLSNQLMMSLNPGLQNPNMNQGKKNMEIDK